MVRNMINVTTPQGEAAIASPEQIERLKKKGYTVGLPDKKVTPAMAETLKKEAAARAAEDNTAKTDKKTEKKTEEKKGS
jgi:hypothetical protein